VYFVIKIGLYCAKVLWQTADRMGGGDMSGSFLDRIQAKYMLEAMAFPRTKWVRRVESALSGALGEYAKQRYAELAGFKDHDWTPEVQRLLAVLLRYFDANFVQVTFTDINKAFKEAYLEASLSQAKVVAARNKIEGYLDRSEIKNFHKLTRQHLEEFDASRLLHDMLEQLAPELLARLAP